MPRSISCIITLLLLLPVGCGKPTPADQANLVPVKGIVRQASKPLPRVLVTFIPGPETLSVPAQGMTNAEGAYELTNVRGNKGLAPGEYLVTISRRLMPDGKEVPPEDRTPPMESPARESLPPRYSDPEKTELKANVQPGGTWNFDLK